MSEEAIIVTARVEVDVIYCAVCLSPPEYCEFSTSTNECKSWLHKTHPSLFADLYPNEELLQLKDLTIEESSVVPVQETKKKIKQVQVQKKKLIVITTVERNKKKRVTHITDVDLKKAAKLFASRFATGSSVSKTGAGVDEIVIQGDVADELFDVVVQNFKSVTLDDMTFVETKKKKIAPPAIAAQTTPQ